MITFATAVLSVLLSVAAQFALKAGMTAAVARGSAAGDAGGWLSHAATVLSQPGVLMGLTLYVVSVLFWLSVLSRWDVSKAYPLVGLGFVITVGVGYVLGESVTATRVTGVVLIALGVALVART